jgi:hypothetical protein
LVPVVEFGTVPVSGVVKNNMVQVWAGAYILGTPEIH